MSRIGCFCYDCVKYPFSGLGPHFLPFVDFRLVPPPKFVDSCLVPSSKVIIVDFVNCKKVG